MEWTEDTGSFLNEALSKPGLVCSGPQPRDSQGPTVVLPGKHLAVWTSAEESLGGQGGERTDSTGAQPWSSLNLALSSAFKERSFGASAASSPAPLMGSSPSPSSPLRARSPYPYCCRAWA